MDQFQRYGNLLRNDGTNQLQRLSPALESDYILPDERTLSDLLTYARQLAAEIRFFSLTGKSTGDWQPFLDAMVRDLETGEIYDPASLEALLQSRRDWPPHLTLFVVFLQLFSYLQRDLNELPQRHLRHYYEQELNLLRREAQADEVHVIFELARNAAPTLIAAGTLLDAGKDSEGRPLYYTTQSDLVVNAAQVTDRFRLVGETDRRGFRRFFVAEEISELEGESWYTFGRKQLDLDPSQRFMTEAQIGFAIASPILLMAEGDRTLTIKAQLRSATDQQPVEQGLDSAFWVDLTGAEGWLPPDTVTATLQEERVQEGDQSVLKPVLTMTVTCSATAPAIVAFDPALHGDGPVADWPVIRCHLNTALGYYDILDGLIVESATLSVDVKGVKNLVVQNNQGVLTPDQPMPLFGTQPRIGSPFFVGSAEVFRKKLTNLKLHLEWQDLPESFTEHYRAYFDEDVILEATDFKVYLEILYDQKWPRLLGNVSLFQDDSLTKTIAADDTAFLSAFNELNLNYIPKPGIGSLAAYQNSTINGFIRLKLWNPIRDTEPLFEAFGHQIFPKRYATQAIALSRWEETDDETNLEPEIPNEPITPILSSLSLDYIASVDLVPENSYSENILFQLNPFGYVAASTTMPARLFPSLSTQISSEIDDQFAIGILYIGVTNFTPPANISLLFQIDKGTAGTANILGSNATEWSYLSGDAWTILPRAAILTDSTYGFQEPGLVVLSIGRDASFDHTTMPAGHIWLRALIRQTPDSAARTLNLSAQAVRASFSPTVGELPDYSDHLQTGLAAETIQRLKRRSASIKAVRQPYLSFGGRSSETDTDFFRRCSEQLRHRNRAITTWDFERLVLEAFPEIFKVKCLLHSNADGENQPGAVALVVVPDVRDLPSLEPRAGAVLISRIDDYVNTNLATPFATIEVIHPVYEQIRVDAQVAFRSGLDAGYYAEKLNQDLQRFLSPWAYDEGEDIVFGGQIYRSEILAFMEGRDYVDYITEFNLYHSHDNSSGDGIEAMTINQDFFIRPDPQPSISDSENGMVIGDTFIVGRGLEAAKATQSHSILVSHKNHRIVPIKFRGEQCAGVKTLGIGYMTIGIDFDIKYQQSSP